MAIVNIRNHSERKVSAGGRSEHGDILRLIVLQHDPIGLMDHLICPGQRIVRAKRIVGDEHIQAGFLRESKRFPDGTGSRRRYHPAADQEEVGLICLFPVDQFQDGAAHDLDTADIKRLVFQVRDPVLCILLSPVLQKLFRAHTGPHFLNIHGFYQPLQNFIFNRHKIFTSSIGR